MTKHTIKQEIEGNNHQIAGHNINHYHEAYTPDPNNPNLIVCHVCKYPSLGINAEECPVCHHPHGKERQQQRQALIEKKKNLVKTLGVFILLLFIGSFHLSARTEFDQLDHLIVSASILIKTFKLMMVIIVV